MLDAVFLFMVKFIFVLALFDGVLWVIKFLLGYLVKMTQSIKDTHKELKKELQESKEETN